jgi:transcription termination factor NusB
MCMNDSFTPLPVEELLSTAQDPRHQRRIRMMQALFAYSFTNESTEEIAEIVAELPDIDARLAAAAPERPLADINKVDLAILRSSVFESIHHKTPLKVLIDEAVELAKEFGTESSPRFVNGVLAKVIAPQESSHQVQKASTTHE